jgi:hypothetical protein
MKFDFVNGVEVNKRLLINVLGRYGVFSGIFDKQVKINEKQEEKPKPELNLEQEERLSGAEVEEKKEVCDNIVAVAKHNKERFFSKEFTDLVIFELRENISNALIAVKKTRSLRARFRKKNHQTKHLKRDSRKIIAHYLRKLKNLNPPVR